MTRQDQKTIRDKRLADKLAVKEEKKTEKQELKSWEKMKAKAKVKEAWLD